MNKPTRWSYSSISTYRECPAKWKFSYIDNRPWEPSAAMARGTRLHSMAEDYVRGKITYVPTEVKRIGPLLEQLIHLKAQPEVTWLLDRQWNPTNDPSQAWVKAIVDVHYVLNDVLYVKDYKSGQMYDSHREQLELYGIIGLKIYPEVKRVETSAVYIDTGHEGMDGSLIPAMLPRTIERWEKDAIMMMADENYEPRPGNACRWCEYKKAKGGPCLY